MKTRFKLLIVLVLALLLTDCAGLQNSSYVVEDQRSAFILFTDVKQSTILFKGIESGATMNKFTPSDSGEGLFTRDSLNKLCFSEFSIQLKKRFPLSTLVEVHKQPSTTPRYLLSVDQLHLAWTKERNLMADGGYSPLAMMKMWITVSDMSSDSVLFKLNCNCEVPLRRYSHPWHQAVSLAVARVLDYIESDGRKHELLKP
jgi:hypothetical protein